MSVQENTSTQAHNDDDHKGINVHMFWGWEKKNARASPPRRLVWKEVGKVEDEKKKEREK